MLTRIRYSVTFAKTGKTLKQEIDFKKGFGAIIGPNESGKSMVIEMVRYALFGTAALRGKLEDYKDLNVVLYFEVKGQKYSVQRTPKQTFIMDHKPHKVDKHIGGHGETSNWLATGAKPTNDKVVQILGFGMDVFDMSCVALQGEIEKLGSMGAADRKRLVDSVIGMSVIEDMIKMATTEAATFGRDAENIKSILRKPEEPVSPEGYHEKIHLDFEELKVLKTEFDQLAGALSVTLTEPKEPSCSIDESEYGHLKAIKAKRDAARWALEKLESDMLPYSTPEYTKDELEEFNQRLAQYAHLSELQSQADHLSELLVDLDDHLTSCPNCGHRWMDDTHDQIATKTAVSLAEVKDKIEGYADIGPPPPLTAQQVRTELHNLEIFNEQQRNFAQRKELGQYITSTPDPTAQIKVYENYLVSKQVFDENIKTYHEKLEARKKAENRFLWLSLKMDGYPAAEALDRAAYQYEMQLAHYAKDVTLYNAQVDKVTELAGKQADWLKAKEALQALRTQIKQHLVPSLSKWASRLLSRMTNGERREIVVSEDFDITVDGQPINTLSGSGKAVANLALRIGLGQVLTNGVFSLFVGDEIDAAMDSQRAGSTAETLQNLRKDISQILLVTHKYPAADYYIELGK